MERGPFIQVDFGALDLYPSVAMLAGVGEEHIHRGFNRIWQHCYRTKTDEMPAALFKSFWPPSQSIIEACATCGFIEVKGDSIRVKGIARRYHKDYSAKVEAGRRGGKATSQKLPREAGRFTKQTPPAPAQQDEVNQAHQAATKHVLGESTKQTKQSTKQPTKQNDQHEVPEATPTDLTPNPSATRQPPSTCLVNPPSRPSRAPSTCLADDQANQADPKSKILSPSGREDLEIRSPAQRESHAPPPEGAGRDSRTGSSEGTRGETPAVPESPAPAPAGPSPKDPVPADRWRLWLPEQLPSPTPPPESEWANAMAWRLMRLTRFAENARPRDYAHLAEQQRVTEELYRDVCDELAPRVTEYQGLALLYHLDDRLSDEETDTSTKLLRWLRTETRPQEVMSDAIH